MKKCPFCAEQIQDDAIKCRYCGSLIADRQPQQASARLSLPDDAIDAEVRQLLNAFRRIDAITLVRDRKGLGLAEARAYVEALDTPSASEPPLNSHRLAATPTLPALIVLAGIAYFSYQYACSTSPPGKFRNVGAQRLQQIHNDVAADLVEQYFIAKRAGKPMDACVHAGIVAAAYLQAKDESLYRLWKQTEKQDCVNAGLFSLTLTN